MSSQIARLSPPSTFYSFTEEAVDKVILVNEKHPRKFLSSMHRIVSQALRENEEKIDLTYVEDFLKVKNPKTRNSES